MKILCVFLFLLNSISYGVTFSNSPMTQKWMEKKLEGKVAKKKIESCANFEGSYVANCSGDSGPFFAAKTSTFNIQQNKCNHIMLEWSLVDETENGTNTSIYGWALDGEGVFGGSVSAYDFRGHFGEISSWSDDGQSLKSVYSATFRGEHGVEQLSSVSTLSVPLISTCEGGISYTTNFSDSTNFSCTLCPKSN